MLTSSLTSKGQVTIPNELRQLLNLHPGDSVGFSYEDNHIILFKRVKDIESSFGICKPRKTASLNDIEAAIAKRGRK